MISVAGRVCIRASGVAKLGRECLAKRAELPMVAKEFRALEDPAFFRRVRVDPELGTIVWPNDVDFCPELLRQWVAAGCVPAWEREGATQVVN